MSAEPTDPARLRRWRLVLGGATEEELPQALPPPDAQLERALDTLYDPDRSGGLGAGGQRVQRWLGEVRRSFPPEAVQLLQRDALEALDLRRLLAEPELLDALEPDVHLVASILALRGALPARSREAARQVVRRVVEALQRRLAEPTRQAVLGGQRRAASSRRPRPSEIDWHRTIRANLRHYQPTTGGLVPERLVGQARQRSGLHDLVLAVDQSASMASSVVWAGVLAASLASLPTVRTRLAVFDTEVVELSEHLQDPVELLFAAQLGGGTDLGRALSWCLSALGRPDRSVVVLLSDLFDGGDEARTLRLAAQLVHTGARVLCLLALSDEGRPACNHRLAARFAALGIPTFACPPERFPELVGAALSGEDLSLWASRQGLVTERPGGPEPEGGGA